MDTISSPATGRTQQKPLKIAFIDDSITFRLLWQRRTDLGEVKTYDRPESFLLELQSPQANSWDVVITDMHFTPSSSLTGVDLAREILLKRPDQVIFLCSHLPEVAPDALHLFQAVLSKDSSYEITLEELVALLNAA